MEALFSPLDLYSLARYWCLLLWVRFTGVVYLLVVEVVGSIPWSAREG